MQRGFSIFLILFFGLGPLSATIDGSEDAGLPPCCRRHGAHHCAMYAQIMAMRARQALDPRPQVSAPSTCPAYPGPSAFVLMPAHALAAQASALPSPTAGTSEFPAVRATFPSSSGRAHFGRGPPAAI